MSLVPVKKLSDGPTSNERSKAHGPLGYPTANSIPPQNEIRNTGKTHAFRSMMR